MPVQPLKDFISFSPPSIGEKEILEVVDTLRSGWLTTGPKTERFEGALKEYVGAAHAVAVNSCTAAMHLALNALEVGPSHGVITTPFTFASTGHVILYQGARPFLVDVEPGTFNIDPEKVKAFLETACRLDDDGRPVHRATGLTIKVLLPVHYGGHPCRMDELTALASQYHLTIVEDAAHAIGTRYKDRPVGSIGDLTCFSFYATKNLTTGEGGMIVTDDEALAHRCRMMAMYGISDARRIWQRYAPKGSWVYDVVDLGFKYNMMDIQASLGLHQLAKLDIFNLRRAENAAAYQEVLSQVPELRLPVEEPYARHAWHLYPILVDTDRLDLNRDTLIERLKDLNVGTSVLFIPLHYHTCYQDRLPYREGDFPVAEKIFKSIINLPVSPAVSVDNITRIGHVVAGLIEEHRRS